MIRDPIQSPATELSHHPPWLLASLMLAASIIAIVAMVLPGIALGGTSAAPLLAPGIGIALALAGFWALPHLAGVSHHALFIHRPTRSALRWTAMGFAIAWLIPLSVILVTGTLPVVLISDPRMIVLAVTTGLLIGAWTGIVEEVLLRGYLLGVLMSSLRWPAAVAISAGVFGLLHHAAATTVLGRGMYIAVTATAGICFALITIRTSTVWEAVGMHAAWNATFAPAVMMFEENHGMTPLFQFSTETSRRLLGGTVTSPTESPLALGAFLTLALLLIWSIRSETH